MLDASTSHVIHEHGARAVCFPHAPVLRSDVRVCQAHGLLATPRATLKGVWGANRVALIGADVLDGVYSAGSSLKRLRALQLAHRLGRKVRVMGSSWSTKPAPEVAAFLKHATWLDVLARDPISHGRMEAAFERPIRLVADLGFLLKPEARSPTAQEAVAWVQDAKSKGGQVLGVNLSGHTIRDLPGKSVVPFVELVKRWMVADATRHVILMPHDTRPGYAGDVTVLQEMSDALTPDLGARLHTPLGPGKTLDAWDLKAIGGEIDLVLTGRMHLAIACLGMGTPPLSLVYQDKFEGLMQHFGLSEEGLTIDPGAVGADNDADQRLEQVSKNAAALSARIKAKLPGITALSRSNFDGLV